MHLRSCLLQLTLCNSRCRSWERVAFLKGVVLLQGWWEKLEADPKALCWMTTYTTSRKHILCGLASSLLL